MADIGPSAADWFGSMVEQYDGFIRRVVPVYDDMIRRLIQYLPPAPARVLELGCGTGNLSLALCAWAPEASYTFVDAAEEMVEVTRSRVSSAHPDIAARSRFVVGRFEDLRLRPGIFDLVTSCLSLHHVQDKRGLFRRIRPGIASGGSFSFADQVSGGSELNQSIHWARYVGHWRGPGRCTEEEIQALLEHARLHDHYAALREQFRLLDEAGFERSDCVWRDGFWTVITSDAS